MAKGISRKYLLLIFPIISIFLMVKFMKIPDEPNWFLIIFLSLTAILDRLNTKVFSSYGYSFSLVILGLLIFDSFSIIYSLVYIFFSFLVLWIKRKPEFWFVFLPLLSIQLVIIVIGNEFYNLFSAKDYIGRYFTLLILLFLGIFLYYIAIVIETGYLSTSIYLSIFGPILFETVLVFPFLSLFDNFNYLLIVVLFINYYIFMGVLHKKYLNINEHHVQELIRKLNLRRELEVLFMDIGNIKGIFHPEKKLIVIDEKMDFPEQLQTVVHEWIHYKLKGKHKLIKPIEEVVVTILEGIISWYYILTITRTFHATNNISVELREAKK